MKTLHLCLYTKDECSDCFFKYDIQLTTKVFELSLSNNHWSCQHCHFSPGKGLSFTWPSQTPNLMPDNQLVERKIGVGLNIQEL
ncbi:hypothetical protein DSO57_1016544 [Entomophthora muscae]|uniref:Uncharacterized protein n=1 Tax=Entomophthora muscae TaxID=34485 RepID=A0ACC2RJL6_9FUNG|nr:hypothetical protein DSO57_1016544 [Entomophthora muscae]